MAFVESIDNIEVGIIAPHICSPLTKFNERSFQILSGMGRGCSKPIWNREVLNRDMWPEDLVAPTDCHKADGC